MKTFILKKIKTTTYGDCGMKKCKVIIDTDPGVDDSVGMIYALCDPVFDIQLITISNGNIDIDNATRNMCFLLDILGKDVPVVKAYRQRFGHSTEDATFLHGKEGLGGFKPPKTTKHQPLQEDAADAIYETLKKHPKEITMMILGPHTTFANLMIKHPDSRDLIKDVLMMGGAPMGIKTDPNHNSFNIRVDAPSFQYTIDAKLPTIMCPSSIGRDWGYFTEEQVNQLKETNNIGRFMAKMFETYWEPNYPDKRIANNDVSTIYSIVYPKLYKMKRAFIEVDTKKYIGKTTAKFSHKGNFKVVIGLKRKKFINLLFERLKSFSDIKLNCLKNKKG